MQITYKIGTAPEILLGDGELEGGHTSKTCSQVIDVRESIDGESPERVPMKQYRFSMTLVVVKTHASYTAAEVFFLKHEQDVHGTTGTIFFYHDHAATPGTDTPDEQALGCTVTVKSIAPTGITTKTTYLIEGGTIDDYSA